MESVHSLGVVIDNTQSFEHKLTLFAKQLLIILPRLYNTSRRVTTDVTLTIASTLVGAIATPSYME